VDNTAAAIETLKRALKLHGLTYRDAAKHLNLSEASVKKMFSSHNITLKRINALCEMMHLDFIDLVRLFDESRERISHLKPEQEQELVRDTKLLLVALCARNHWKFDETFVEMIHFSDTYQKAPEEIKEYATALNIVKTVVPVNAPFSEQSITFGLRKAADAGYDHEMLEDVIDNVMDQLGIVADY